MNRLQPNLPQAVPTIRPNGDVAIDLTHQGQVVGSLNVTCVVERLFAHFGIFQDPAAPRRLP